MRRKQIYIAVSVFIVGLLAIAGSLLMWRPTASAPGSTITPTPDKRAVSVDTTETPPETPKETFNKTQFSTSEPSSPWVVVNKQHPLNPKSYAPSDLISVGNGQRMRTEAANALKQMFADATTAGYTLVADSGYRSYSAQVSTYNGYVKQMGQVETDKVSARPGYSEHQTGWTVDIGSGNCHVDNCFKDTPGGQWAQAHAYKYGFMLRYPEGLTPITGYSHESWHFRYVGTALSTELHNQDTASLEEFFSISGGTTYK